MGGIELFVFNFRKNLFLCKKRFLVFVLQRIFRILAFVKADPEHERKRIKKFSRNPSRPQIDTFSLGQKECH